jgi:hypothetical protein
VFWQGIAVGHIRKYDDRLRVELLRAHMPRTFKSPSYGGNLAVNLNATVRAELVALRQEALRQIQAGRLPEKPANAIDV